MEIHIRLMEMRYIHSVPFSPPFKRAALTPGQILFNEQISELIVSVEWVIGMLQSQFAFLDYRKTQKLYLQPVGKYYIAATLVTNCQSCLYGNETTEVFGITPP